MGTSQFKYHTHLPTPGKHRRNKQYITFYYNTGLNYSTYSTLILPEYSFKQTKFEFNVFIKFIFVELAFDNCLNKMSDCKYSKILYHMYILLHI